MNKMYRQIKAIFDQVESKWSETNNSAEAFPKICYDALELEVEYNPESVKEIIQESNVKQSYPNDEFGEVPITVFSNKDFFIDIYNWNTHHTAIHDHNFLGAFKLLHGRSHQFSYEFKIENEISKNIKQGKLKKSGSKIIKAGDRQKILEFKDFIHEVFHFENPTVTLLIRNYWYPENLNTYTKDFMVKLHFLTLSLKTKAQALTFLYNTKSSKSKDTLLNALKKNGDDFIAMAISKTTELFNGLIDQESRDNLINDITDICKNSNHLPPWVKPYLESIEHKNKSLTNINKLKRLY